MASNVSRRHPLLKRWRQNGVENVVVTNLASKRVVARVVAASDEFFSSLFPDTISILICSGLSIKKSEGTSKLCWYN